MSHAVKAVTTERGLDAGSFTMVVYGGAGPLHASAIARETRHPQGADPVCARLLLGLRHAVQRPALRLRALACFRKLDDVSFEDIEALYKGMEDEGRAAIAQSAVQARRRSSSSARPTCATSARSTPSRWTCRPNCFEAQGPRGDQAAVRRRCTSMRYGTSAPKEPADLVSLRVTVHRHDEQAAAAQRRQGQRRAAEGRRCARVKPVYFRESRRLGRHARLHARRAARRQCASPGRR